MQYEVQVVGQDELPPGHDLVIVERDAGQPAIMLITGRPAEVWAAMRDWEASHGPCVESTLLHAI